jgi:hypothetical protein
MIYTIDIVVLITRRYLISYKISLILLLNNTTILIFYVADALKLVVKETVIPAHAIKSLFYLAPVITLMFRLLG